MTTGNEEKKTREDNGAAGSPPEVSQRGHSEPGTAPGTGHEGKDTGAMAKPDPAGPEPLPAKKAVGPVRAAPKPVERATALRGRSIARPRTKKSTLRRRTLEDLRDRDPEVPYWKYEAASRDLICSLMERQDRMNEEIFNRIIDLEYRLNDAEDEPAPVRTGRNTSGPGG